jgi:enoyl-CoA hydratase
MLKEVEAMNYIQFEIKGPVAVLRVNRPESLNALNSQVVQELGEALHKLDQADAVKVVILTGAGDKAFVAGGDIKEMLALDVEGARSFSRRGQEVMLFIESMRKPVIAAVNGYALGGGLELALACDFIYAAEKARFGLTEVTLGVLPGFGGTQNLTRLIGPALARELIFTGRVLNARDALDWGIVNAVFPDAKLLERTMETALKIAANGSLAVASSRQAVNRGLGRLKADGFMLENELFAGLFSTEDRQEGLQAFLEKRPAKFKGN